MGLSVTYPKIMETHPSMDLWPKGKEEGEGRDVGGGVEWSRIRGESPTKSTPLPYAFVF
ncbi:hypothetical protein CRG98_010493 [Punica granatum]|uniref:Uncharacterized protein n=1 Tax=Punica granatum TaxID=22663 RepID=A0A2I0KKU4_PUNGR|nr:hypothetical protein CRG98_010493 [Punica granatum]